MPPRGGILILNSYFFETMTDIHNDKILILDFGSQYTQLIARRVRELGVYCEIWAYDNDFSDIQNFAPRGIVLSGGPSTVTEDHTPRAPKEIFDMGIPVLGICYGLQCMASMLGGEVSTSDKREFGHAEVALVTENALIKEAKQNVWMSHGDKVTVVPEGFKVIAESDNAPLCGIADETRRFYGVQFHPETTHSENGLALL